MRVWTESETFRDALARVERAAESAPLAVTCAETLWWQCHRDGSLAYDKGVTQELFSPRPASPTKTSPG